MQIFCDAEAKPLMRSLQGFFFFFCLARLCVSSPEAKNRVGGIRATADVAEHPLLHRAWPDRSDIHAQNQYVQAVTGRLLTVEYLIMLRVEREETPGKKKIPQLLNFWTSRIMKNGTAWSHDIWWNKHGVFKMQTTKNPCTSTPSTQGRRSWGGEGATITRRLPPSDSVHEKFMASFQSGRKRYTIWIYWLKLE